MNRIKYILAICFIVLLGTLFFDGSIYKSLYKKTLKEKLSSTIQVVGHYGIGTGIIIKSEKTSPNIYSNYFLTCIHVINRCPHNRVYLFDRTEPSIISYEVQVVHRVTNFDLAICKFNTSVELNTIEFHDNIKDVALGDDIEELSWPGQFKGPTVTRGKLINFNYDFIKTKNAGWVTNTITVPGSSGGAILKDDKYISHVVAVYMMGNDAIVPNYTISISGLYIIDEVNKFFNQKGNK